MMRKLLTGLLFLFCAGAGAAANWPDTISSDSNLYIAVNNCATTLSSNITSTHTTITVADTSCFPTVGYATIGTEAFSYTGKTATTFTGCTRGADSTSAASHTAAEVVFHAVIAAHHNALKDELIAMSTFFFEGSTVHIDTTNVRVGISTNTPSCPFHVKSSTYQVYLQQDNIDNGWNIFANQSDGNLDFLRFGEGASPSHNTRMSIDTNGNVGIGTGSPSSKLDVEVTGGNIADFNSTAGAGGYITLQRSGAIFSYIGNSASLVGAGATDDLGIRSENGINICTNGSTSKVFISTNGTTFLTGAAPYITFDVVATTPTTQANHVSIWGVNEASGEMKVLDGAGNVTKISPHNEKGEWVFQSENVKTGRRLFVNMEKFIRAMEKFTGEKFIIESN